MKKKLTVRLDKNDEENLTILYKHFQIPNETDSKRFRKLLACLSERILHGSQDVKSSRQKDQVGLLEGWDCPCRFTFSRYHRPTKEWHRKVLCSNPSTKRILGTNELDAEICKRCHDTGGSANLPILPEPKQEVLKPTPKAQQVQRLCNDCQVDISNQPSNHTLCRNCWFKKLKGAKAAGEFDKNPPEGSPAWLRKQQAARLRKLDERMKATKEE